jgi:6-phosphofructokinase 1
MKRIGILTSGGDCSGMNAAIRSVVRNALARDIEVIGFQQGFSGILDEKYEIMDSRSVSGILDKAGTVLRTARCEEFRYDRAQEQAIETFDKLNLDGLVVIGGNGSLAGAFTLYQKGFKVVGIPASIDNDISGTDISVGADTALNGYLALIAGISSGAEATIIPEVEYDIEEIAANLFERYKAGKTNSLVIVAEGASSAHSIERKLKNQIGYETRISVLGHIQRGGGTTVFDRLLASKFGQNAVELLIEGEIGVATVLRENHYKSETLERVVSEKKTLSPQLLDLAQKLAS